MLLTAPLVDIPSDICSVLRVAKCQSLCPLFPFVAINIRRMAQFCDAFYFIYGTRVEHKFLPVDQFSNCAR
jgi:hypothetical protein